MHFVGKGSNYAEAELACLSHVGAMSLPCDSEESHHNEQQDCTRPSPSIGSVGFSGFADLRKVCHEVPSSYRLALRCVDRLVDISLAICIFVLLCLHRPTAADVFHAALTLLTISLFEVRAGLAH